MANTVGEQVAAELMKSCTAEENNEAVQSMAVAQGHEASSVALCKGFGPLAFFYCTRKGYQPPHIHRSRTLLPQQTWSHKYANAWFRHCISTTRHSVRYTIRGALNGCGTTSFVFVIEHVYDTPQCYLEEEW